MKIVVAQLLLFVVSISVSLSQSKLIENKLFELPDVIFKEISSYEKDATAYELKIKQPIDHTNPDKGFFYQRAFLSHKGFENPTVLVTEGYTCVGNWPTEVTSLINANQLAVEHRYFGESMPDTVNYNYLNLEQATADLHHINQLFRGIYKNAWVSTGISKGGATSIYYKYFYPDDVDVSIPYVAPINVEFEDQRIYDFLDTIGSSECRDKIYLLQIRWLKNRSEILPLLKFYSMGAKLKFNYLALEEAFEYAVLEYPFSFFQWGYDCDDIPTDNASVRTIVDYLINVSGFDLFSDRSIEAFGSHYYQSAHQMGYYGYEVDKFDGLLKSISADANPHATFLPNKMTVEFDGSLLDDINSWIYENGHDIIYIYGAKDTWSASAVRPSNNVNALWFFMEGKSHGDARIRNMSTDEREQLIQALEQRLQIKIPR
ncbi:MAG: S28 family serine protease [Bacteroidota bacterium]